MTARNFAPISIDELKAKIDAALAGAGNRYNLRTVIEADLKVKFGFENFEQKRNRSAADNSLMGYHTEVNGLTYCGLSAGDDGEFPVFFVVYWDGNKLRAYIPTEGNIWNKKTNKAYSANGDAPAINEELLKADIITRILPPGMKSIPTLKPVKKPTAKPRPSKKPTVEQLVLQEINEIKLRLDRLAAIVADSIKE